MAACRGRTLFFDHLVAERGAFRIIFLESLFGKLWRREYREVVDVAIQTVVIVKSFIKLARFLLYLSGMREFGIIVIALVVLSAATVRWHSHFVPRPTGPLPAVNVP
jgi:hypothetical protein